MAVTYLVGPPGSGKTRAMVALVRDRALEGERIWWVCPSHVRDHALRTLTREGPLLGVDAWTVQQVAYRLAGAAQRPNPSLTGTGRLATVAVALTEDRGSPPSPGEARLFARAIAEAKRHGVTGRRLPGRDPETARLRRVAKAYERFKGSAWDYDDFLLHATRWLHGAPEGHGGARAIEADRIVVDGFATLDAAEVALVEALGLHVPVHVAVEREPHGRPVATRLEARETCVQRYRFPNPVSEVRWVLRDVKSAIAHGVDPLDLAVVVPHGSSRAVAVVAEEFGIPVMDETPRGLADSLVGRRLLDLLDLADHPTAPRLLGIDDLRDLGERVLEAGVAGDAVVTRLADLHGQGEVWRAWRSQLRLPEDRNAWLAWGSTLIGLARDTVGGSDDHGGEDGAAERFEEVALQRLVEARRVATDGEGLRAWWAALLHESERTERPTAGVALLAPHASLGRAYARAWIVGATEGAYVAGDDEDYFVPEDARHDEDRVLRGGVLPRRMRGRAAALAAAWLRRAGEVTVTFAEADRSGPKRPDRHLVPRPRDVAAPPARPAGSEGELVRGLAYRPPAGSVEMGEPEVDALLRHGRCGFQRWAEAKLLRDPSDDVPWWTSLRRALTSRRRWTDREFAELATTFPEASAWLAEIADRAILHRFGVRIGPRHGAPFARVDARRDDGDLVRIVTIAPPGAWPEARDWGAHVARGGREAWIVHALGRTEGRGARVSFEVWPILGQRHAFPGEGKGVDVGWAVAATTARTVDGAWSTWRDGRIDPSPGFACRECAVFDLCREGVR